MYKQFKKQKMKVTNLQMKAVSDLFVNTGQIEGLPKNPRFIKNKAYRDLVESLKTYPEMLELRPIVVNEQMVVLGGNQRLKACREAGLEEVPTLVVTGMSIERQKEFIIKDNISFGSWDLDELFSDGWDKVVLESWGLDELIEDDESLLEPEQIDSKYNDENCIYPLIPVYDEKYSAIVIICESKTEIANVRSMLGIIEKRKSYKNSFLGETNIIKAKEIKINEMNSPNEKDNS